MRQNTVTKPDRSGTAARSLAAALPVALLLLAGCEEERPRGASANAAAAASAPPNHEDLARAAADAALRQRLRVTEGEGPRQRGVQVFAQAAPGTRAVCGRVAEAGPLLPYVAVVAFENGEARVAELALGTTQTEATRVYTEMVERCFEGGGPATARVAGTRPMPPLPAVSVTQVAFQTPAPEPPAAAARRTVQVGRASAANVRASPRGGEVLRTAPRGAVLEVFGEAPGGWLQVGQDGAAWGWVHASLLEPRP